MAIRVYAIYKNNGEMFEGKLYLKPGFAKNAARQMGYEKVVELFSEPVKEFYYDKDNKKWKERDFLKERLKILL